MKGVSRKHLCLINVSNFNRRIIRIRSRERVHHRSLVKRNIQKASVSRTSFVSLHYPEPEVFLKIKICDDNTDIDDNISPHFMTKDHKTPYFDRHERFYIITCFKTQIIGNLSRSLNRRRQSPSLRRLCFFKHQNFGIIPY